MAKSALADLVINLTGESADLRRAIRTAQSDLNRFTKDVRGMKRALEGAFTAVGIGLAANAMKNLVVNGAQAADQMGKLSQAAGMSVEDFSRMAYAANLADVEAGEFAQSIGLLSKKITEAAAGGKAADTFRAMGIAVTDANGAIRPTAEILAEVATKFAGYEDGAAKSALAMELFGRSGTKLLPLLNQGAAGIEEMAAQADRLGLTIDSKTAASAEKFNDALTRIGVVVDRLGADIAAKVAEPLDALARAFEEGAAKGRQWADTGDTIAFWLEKIGRFALSTSYNFERLGMRIGAISAGIAMLATEGLDGWRAVEAEFLADLKRLDAEHERRMAALSERPRPPSPTSSSGGTTPAPIVATGGKELKEPRVYAEQFTPELQRGWTPWIQDLNALNASENEVVTNDLLRSVEEYQRKLAEQEEKVRQFGENAARALEGTLGQAVGDTLVAGFERSTDRMVEVWKDALKRMLAQTVMSGFLAFLTGGTGGGGGLFGGFLGGLFGGKRAAGGPVEAGQAYLVGEEGPEILVPNVSGRIVPNHALAGGGVRDVHVHINGVMDGNHLLETLRRNKTPIRRVFTEMEDDGR